MRRHEKSCGKLHPGSPPCRISPWPINFPGSGTFPPGCRTQQTATLEQVHAAQADAGGKQQSGRMRQVRARRRQ